MKIVSKIKIRHALVISLVAVIAVMVLIFYFSAQNAAESNVQSGKVTEIVIRIFYPDYDSMSYVEKIRAHETLSHYVRKAAHLTEYAALGFFLCLFIFSLNNGKRLFSGWAISVAVGALYAASDELHQKFVGGRSAELRDFLIDSAGVILGASLMMLIIRQFEKRDGRDADKD